MATRNARRRALVAIAISALALILAVPAFAQLGTFELDGNTKNPDGLDVDWQDIFTASGSQVDPLPTGHIAAAFDADYELPDSSTFTTGSKDTLDINPGWQCAKSNNVGDKVDIVNAYATAYRSAPGGDLILYFAVEVSSPNGDSNIGVWFLKDGSVGCNANGRGAKTFTGNHQDGDVFVVAAFTNGGRTANVDVYEWLDGSLSKIGTGSKCGTVSGQDACAITNETNFVDPPWAHPDKDGGDLNPQEFFEGGVNITNLGVAEECFATYLANTRSSQSLTATIFDFSSDQFPVCNPSTVLTADANASVTYTFSETNDGDVPLTQPAGGWVTSSDCTVAEQLSGGKNVGDVDGDGVLDVGETFQFTCTKSVGLGSPVTVTVTGHGIDPAGRDVTFCSNGGNTTGFVCDPDERDSVKVEITSP